MKDEDMVVPVDAVQEGMKAADDITGLDGSVIIHKGVEIQTRHIGLLKYSHVHYVRVIPPDTAGEPKETVHINDYPEYADLLKEARVMIVDDSKFLRFKLVKIFEQAGLNVVGQASDGKEAVAVATELKPNMITLDVEMPEYDGIYALTELKKILPDAAIVMISSVGEEEKILEAIGKGAIDFVHKPIDPVNTVKPVITAIILSKIV